MSTIQMSSLTRLLNYHNKEIVASKLNLNLAIQEKIQQGGTEYEIKNIINDQLNSSQVDNFNLFFRPCLYPALEYKTILDRAGQVQKCTDHDWSILNNAHVNKSITIYYSLGY